ncbi:hypothetical protein QJS04_geneDACA004170 [Acorus gramineus]|uniref:Uncharacterized protein n=1 Tax=Acorus gramineus TaxID=55184 RepID=A0AAV9BEE9_ACOGR|nr:hypothetical protein QJS04_geneDACA004170 [Acorus gramineus]
MIFYSPSNFYTVEVIFPFWKLACRCHSEFGWQALIEIILEHYGFEVDQAAVIIFFVLLQLLLHCSFDVLLFKFFPRLSPIVANIFLEMKCY